MREQNHVGAESGGDRIMRGQNHEGAEGCVQRTLNSGLDLYPGTDLTIMILSVHDSVDDSRI
jgi:hypothetical protein